MNKKSFICLMLITLICFLSSCGKEAVDLKFDNKISWSSSYDDIIHAYGQPERLISDKPMVMMYTSFNCCGYSDFELDIYYNSDNARIERIAVMKGYSEYNESLKEYNDILSRLESKYGKPKKENSSPPEGLEYLAQYHWKDQIKDTDLYCTHIRASDKAYSISILYTNIAPLDNGI